MKETFSLELELPEFMRLVDAQAREQIIEEVRKKIHDEVSELFEKNAKKIIAQKLDLISGEGPTEKVREVPDITEKVREVPDITEKVAEMKTSLAEEILSLSEKEALEKLKLSLARGEIDGDTYDELKALVEPITVSAKRKSVTCPNCGKELEPTVNFCRFCGAKLT
ncbi:MAG: zinc-ribbon domain-containing protein [Theionarchaea archaeon]|nr:zinc-ribbon domain-containing protein [Theionarchaea archaeon]